MKAFKMNRMTGVIWLLFGLIRVHSGIVPEATYFSQGSILTPNNNYNLPNQQQGNQDIYYNSASSQNNAATCCQNQQQQYFQKSQSYPTNPVASQNVQSFQTHQSQISQHNINLNPTSNSAQNDKLPQFPVNTQTQQFRAPILNAPANQQNSYSAQTSFDSSGSNNYQGNGIQTVQQTNQNTASAEDGKRTIPQSGLDFIDSKSKIPRKVPLVLITIHKNRNNNDKSKASTKNKNFKEVQTANNAPANNANLGSTANYGSSNINTQNNAHIQQQQPYIQAQGLSYAGQFNRGVVNPMTFGPLTQYRYPILAGKKIESSEWKPVGKIGVFTSSNPNVKATGSQSSVGQPTNGARNQPTNTAYNPPTLNSAQAIQPNAQLSYNTNSNHQQGQQNAPAHTHALQSGSDQRQLNNVNYQVTSAYVQAKVNVENNPSYISGPSANNRPSTGVENNYALNNIQELKDARSVENREQRTHVLMPQTQRNVKNDQTSVPLANNENFASIDQFQSNTNSYKTDAENFVPALARNTQSINTGNTYQSTNFQTKNQLIQNVQNTNSHSLQQNNIQSNLFQSPARNNIGISYNQPQISSNAHEYSRQNTESLNSQNFANNAHANSPNNRNTGNVNQQTYTSSNFNSLPQVNNFARGFTSQNGIPVSASQHRNSNDFQNVNFPSHSQISGQSNAKPYQQVQSAQGALPVQSNQVNNVFQSNFQNSVKASVQGRQNSIQSHGSYQNIRSEAGNSQHNPNQLNRNYLFQNVNNNQQNNVPPTNYESGNVEFNSQSNKESPKPLRNPSVSTQETTFYGNTARQPLTNYNTFNNGQRGLNHNNIEVSQNPPANSVALTKNINENYNNRESGASVSFQNSYRTSQSPIINHPNEPQRGRDSIPVNYRETLAPVNHNFNLNNYQNTNYGSSESQKSVVGSKPNDNTHQPSAGTTIYNQINGDSFQNENQQSFSGNAQQPQSHSTSTDTYNSDVVNKDINLDDNKDSAPEALLLVLVSAKKSLIEGHSDGRSDDINDSYESAPEEVVEFLNSQANRNLIVESAQEAVNAAYANAASSDCRDCNSETPLESDNHKD